jgi:hypothetical protein
MYQDNPVELNSIYMDMADKISSDPDLKNNLNIQRALARINHCLNCADLNKLQDSWKNEFQNTSDETCKHQLIMALLTIKKVKNEKQPEHDYWEKIKPPADWSRNEKVFREQLSLKLRNFIPSKIARLSVTFLFLSRHCMIVRLNKTPQL